MRRGIPRPDTFRWPWRAMQVKRLLRGPGCTECPAWARRKLGWKPLDRSEHRGTPKRRAGSRAHACEDATVLDVWSRGEVAHSSKS